MVRWRSPAEGRLADLDIEVRRAPTVRIAFAWSATGEPVPYDVEAPGHVPFP